MKRTRKQITRLLTFILLVLSLLFSQTSCVIIYYVSDSNTDYACEYFDSYDVPDFDESKYKEFERVYNAYYYLELPAPKEMARLTCEVFFEDYTKKLDTDDENAVTEALINAYLDVVGDKYSIYRSPVRDEEYDTEMSGTFYGIGVLASYHKKTESILISEVYENSGAMDAGILAGDHIVAVNGSYVSDIGYDDAISMIRGDENTTVDLTIIRGEDEFTVTATRRKIVEKTVKYSINENKIGYVQITSFKDNTDEEFEAAIDYLESAGVVGVIYDVRSNPGGYLVSVINALSYIAPTNTKLVTFSNNYGKPKYDNDSHYLEVPSVVIFDGDTASAGELFAATIRDLDEVYECFEVTTVGEKSYGKGIMQTRQTLSDGSSVTLTVAYYTPPNGENYHGVGITPDRIVEEVSGRDAKLDAAYEEIYKLIN